MTMVTSKIYIFLTGFLKMPLQKEKYNTNVCMYKGRISQIFYTNF